MKLSRYLRALAAVTTLGVAGAATAAQTYLPSFSNVPFLTALQDASLVAAQKEGRWVARTDGTSMLPFFGSDSITVVQRIDAARLRPGMIAVYRNADGEQVAHRVVGRTEQGWRVQGFNNDRADTTVVDENNLLGVVYATFNTAGCDRSSPEVSATIATLPVVLGAPAK